MEGGNWKVSKTVDSRVVEMRFDNKQFESGIKQSLGTLQKLKAALKNLTSSNKGLDVLGETAKKSKSSLDSIAESVSALEKRFSFMGETVRKVANTMRDTLVGTVGKAVNYVKEGIVQGGIRRATNIENAHYQLQALLKDEDEVQKVMDNAMAAVDGTAYGFDEAAKAAAMFKASGIESGEAMENALKGIAGTAAMTNADFERISLIFTSVAGQGRLMGDQLLQLSSLGLNAPASIATFFNEIDKDTSKASESVKKAVKEITNGTEVTEADIRSMVSDGMISFQMFAEAMYDAFGESAAKANETFNGSLSNMRAALARIGAEFVSPLIAQNSSVVLLINKVKDKINEVKKALTFSKEANNVEAYSKRFTDSILKMADGLGKWVEALDVASGMKVFYNVVDSLINVFKALWSIIKPVGQAFADVFMSFKVGDVINATDTLKKFTESLRLSSSESENLHDAAEGVFSIVKLLVDAIVGLMSALFNINPPIADVSEGFFGLIGAIGRGLSAFSDWIRQSKLVNAAFNLISSGAKLVGNMINSLIGVVKNFVSKAVELKVVENIVNAVLSAFKALGEFAAPYIDVVTDKLKDLGEIVKDLAGSAITSLGDWLYKAFRSIKETISNLRIGDANEQLDKFQSIFKSMMDTFGGGFSGFVGNIKEFGEKVKEAFDFTKIVDNLIKFKELIQDFVGWFKDAIGSLFGNASLGGMFAGAGGVGIIYTIIQISKSLEKAVSGLSSIPKLLGSVSEALKNWGASMKADALKKNAEAILILAAALVVLSFTDTDKALEASIALSVIAGVLMAGTTKLTEAVNAGRGLSAKINYFAKGLGKALNQFGKAIKWKAIGSAFKDFGESVALIAGSLIALGLMYSHDAESLKHAEMLVAVMAGVIIAIMAAMVAVEKKLSITGSGVIKTSLAVLAITGAVSTIVGALKKIMKINLPSDYKAKFAMLSGMLGELAVVTVALGYTSKLAAGSKIKSGPIIAVALALKVCVSALNDVFKIEFDSDWGKKVGTLSLMFIELGGLIMALGYAQQQAGGAIKGTGTLLALAADIGVITAALMVLSIIPAEGMMKGAVALGGVLLVLAGDLAAVSKITTQDTAKTVLNMAIMVGAITASLGVLSMVPVQELAVSAAALGTMLLVLAGDFLAISKISNESVWQPVVAMVGVLVTISGSLYILSNQPWQGIIAAGVSMSLALTAFSAAFLIISKAQGVDVKKAGMFLAFTLAAIPIGTALYALSNQPWQGMLAAAASISVVLTAFVAAFAIISKSNPKLASVVAFVAAAVALIPISAALNMLSGQDWNSLMPAAAALAVVSGSLGVAMALMSKANITGVIGFVAAAVALIPIAAVIKELAGLPFDQVVTSLIALAGGLTVIGVAGLAGSAIAGPLLALSAALLVFAAAIAAVGVAIPVFVDGLGTAFDAIYNFLDGLNSAIGQMFEAGKNLMLGLAQGIMDGIGSVIDTISGVASGVVDTICGLLGIHSPSTIFEAIGLNVDEGFVNGLTGGADSISGAMESVFGGLADKVDVSAMMPKGLESTEMFGAGLISGEANVDNIMQQMADATGMDMSSFTTKGEEGAGNLESGLASGESDIDKVIQQLVNVDGTDVKGFSTLGQDASSNYGFGLKKGEKNVNNTVKQITNPGKTDLSSYTKLGNTASDKFTSGMKAGVKDKAPGVATIVANTLKTEVKNAIEGKDFTASGKSISDAISKGISSNKDKVKSAIESVMKIAKTAIKEKDSTFKTSGSQTITAYASGIKSKSSSVSDAIKSVLKKLTNEIKSTNKEFKTKGQGIITNLSKGIKAKTPEAVNRVENVVSKMVKTLKAQAKNFQTPGKDSANQYVKAIRSTLDSGMKSLVSNMSTIGKQMVQGLAKGINANMGIARAAASQLAKQVDQQVKKDLDIHSPSKVAAKRGKQFIEGFADGVMKNIGIAKEAVGKFMGGVVDQFGNDIKAIKKKLKNYNFLSDDYYLKAIQKATTKANKALNKELKNIGGRFAEFIKHDEYSKSYIDSEEDYWEKLLAIKQSGADKEKYIGMDINEFRQSMLDDYQGIMDEYHNTLAQEQSNIFGQVNMFESIDKSLLRTRQEQADYDYEIAKKEEEAAKQREKNNKKDKETSDVKKEIVKTMGETFMENNKLLDQYEKELKKAKKNIGDTNLWNYLVDQGLDALPKLIEINRMSKKEQKAAIQDFDNAMQTAYTIAVIKMGDVTDETRKNIDEMFSLNQAGIEKGSAQKEESLSLEDQYWTRLLHIKQAGVDQEKYLEMDLKTFREGVLAETNQIIQDYQQQFESTKANIMSQMGIFDEVEAKQAKTSEELIKIMQDQVIAYQEYGSIMDSLMTRLAGTNLLTEIQDMGVGSIDQLRVINGMTDDELSQYAGLYDQKLEEAGAIAGKKMEDITSETEQKLKELFGVAGDINLDEFTSKFDGTLGSLESFLLEMGGYISDSATNNVTAVNDMSKQMGDALTEGMTILGEAAYMEAANLGTSIATGINEASPEAADAAGNVAQAAATAIQNEKGDFQAAGKKVGSSYVQGVNKTQNEAKNAGTAVANKTVGGIDSKAAAFTTEGTKVGTNFVNGVKEQISAATNAGMELANGVLQGLQSVTSRAARAAQEIVYAALDTLRNAYYDFYNAGTNAGQGYANGLASKKQAAADAAKALADVTTKTTTTVLKIESPSKIMKGLGNYAGMGYVNGILSCVAKAEKASEELGEATQNGTKGYLGGLTSVLTDDLISNPTITPEVDLTNVYQSIADINRMFNEAIRMTVSEANIIDSGIKINKQRRTETDQSAIQKGGSTMSDGGNTFNFTQNNYSPKPLSRSDIYRQTNNQFTLFKTVVSSV